MKIGIVTFHRARNYGAMLQAYALKKSLSTEFDTSIVDYRSPMIEGEYYAYEKGTLNRIKEIARWILRHKHTVKVNRKKKRFTNFYNKYLKDDNVYTEDNISVANNYYDIFISGSDQVWCTKLTKCDWNYYLKFADVEKRYSYAASFGVDEVELLTNKSIIGYLKKYNNLLLREESAKDILESRGDIDKDISVVCDPVFLLSKKKWEGEFQLIKESPKKEKYILVYIVAKEKDLIDFTKQLARKKALKVKYINLYGYRNICDKEFEDILDAGPREFLELIHSAEYVVTTSFHAMSFALLFNVPFFYELSPEKNNSNSRLEGLSEKMGMSAREIINGTCNIDDVINWELINEKIMLYRKKSMKKLYDTIVH